eukprot:scaffold6260_cov304-Pinguiococcus_pyrenoidosus.AAC.2
MSSLPRCGSSAGSCTDRRCSERCLDESFCRALGEAVSHKAQLSGLLAAEPTTCERDGAARTDDVARETQTDESLTALKSFFRERHNTTIFDVVPRQIDVGE